MREVTPEQVEAAVRAANIERVEHHPCGLCGYPTAYVVIDGQLFFDPGCDCSRSGPSPIEPRAWSDASNWINMQSRDDVRVMLMRRFGLEA